MVDIIHKEKKKVFFLIAFNAWKINGPQVPNNPLLSNKPPRPWGLIDHLLCVDLYELNIPNANNGSREDKCP